MEPPKFLEFYAPHKVCFITFLLTNFQNLQLYVRQFFGKFPKFSKKFPDISQLFQNRKKTIIFVTKLVQNDYIDQNLVKFSHNIPKTANFSLKPSIFKIFGAENLEFYVPKKPIFLKL